MEFVEVLERRVWAVRADWNLEDSDLFVLEFERVVGESREGLHTPGPKCILELCVVELTFEPNNSASRLGCATYAEDDVSRTLARSVCHCEHVLDECFPRFLEVVPILFEVECFAFGSI